MTTPILYSFILSGLCSLTLAAANPSSAGPVTGQMEFERDARHTRRRAKELTDSLRIRGRADALSEKGLRAMLRRDYVGAEEAYREMAASFPERAAGHQLLGDLSMQKRDFAGAARLYTQAMEQDPQARHFYLLLRGRAFLFGGKASQALADAEDGLKQASWDSGLHEIRATALIHLGRYGEAARSYQTSWDLGPREWTPEDRHACTELGRHGYNLKACRKPPVSPES